METKDIITLVIAAWGAILSSYLAFIQIRKEKRKIKASCQLAVRTIKNKNSLFIKMNVTNSGHRPIMINGVGFQFKLDHQDASQDSALEILPDPYLNGDETKPVPKTLGDGEGLELSIPYEPLLSLSKRTGARYDAMIVYDSEGKKYSFPLPKDVSEAINFGTLSQRMVGLLDNPIPEFSNVIIRNVKEKKKKSSKRSNNE